MGDVTQFRFRMDTFGSIANQVMNLINGLGKPCALFLLPDRRVQVMVAVAVPDEPGPERKAAMIEVKLKQVQAPRDGHYVGTFRPGVAACSLVPLMRAVAIPINWHP